MGGDRGGEVGAGVGGGAEESSGVVGSAGELEVPELQGKVQDEIQECRGAKGGEELGGARGGTRMGKVQGEVQERGGAREGARMGKVQGEVQE